MKSGPALSSQQYQHNGILAGNYTVYGGRGNIYHSRSHVYKRESFVLFLDRN